MEKPGEHKVRRVLFFDSGVGGLSVFRDVKMVNPQIEGYYLFDNECFPYGTKSESFLKQRVCSLLTRACENFKPCAVVVACNTASTLVLPDVRATLSIPVVGVVPAIKPAARLSEKKVIGLLATPGTVQRQYTKNLIRSFASDCKIVFIPSPILASIAETRLSTGEVDIKGIEAAVHPLMALEGDERPDVVVLGCTHYPFVVDVLKELMPDIEFIDSGRAIGRRVKQILSLYVKPNAVVEATGQQAFFTGTLHNFKERQRMVARFGFEKLKLFE